MNDLDIKEIRIKLDISQEKLAKMLGVSTRTVQNWESGTKIPVSKHEILHNLLLGDVHYYGGNEERKANLIPLYDSVTSIGGREIEANVDSVDKPTEYIDTGDWFRDATAAIRHYGESMIEYPNGCILAIKEVKDRELIVPGRDYVVETSEYRVTKRIQKGKDDEHITAYSTNAEKYSDGRLIHEPFDIPWRAIVRISLVLGYVVKKNGGTMLFNKTK